MRCSGERGVPMPRSPRIRRGNVNRIDRRGASGDGGQTLVEFSLVIPIFITLLMGVIEFGFLYNNILTVQFAARQGVSVAAQAGGVDGADCSILKAVEKALQTPIDHSASRPSRSSSRTRNGDEVPGTSTATSGRHPGLPRHGHASRTRSSARRAIRSPRRDALAEGLDVIGVRIGYSTSASRPIGVGRTWDVSDGATLRMEPKQ